MRKLLLTFILFAVSVFAFAQRGEILAKGMQKRVPGQDAVLFCEPIKLNKNSVIVAVDSARSGFWISEATSKGEKTLEVFWSNEDVKNAVNYKLKPGTYYFYPNLYEADDSITFFVRIKKR